MPDMSFVRNIFLKVFIFIVPFGLLKKIRAKWHNINNGPRNLVNSPIFGKFYMQSVFVKPFQIV